MDEQKIKENHKFRVIPRVLAFIEKGDDVLMIERSKQDAFAYQKLNGVGGHIEKGEDPLSAIRREVMEESGLDIAKFVLHAVIFIDIETDEGVEVFVFSAEFPGGELHASSEGKLCWVNKRDLLKKKVIKDVPLLLKVIDDSKRDGEVKYLQYRYVNGELGIHIV